MKIVFMGTPGFAVPTLFALGRAGHEVSLVVSQPDRVRGRRSKPAPPEVKAAADQLGLKTIQPEKISDQGVMDALREARPEAIVLVACGHFLGPEVLALPPLGCINAHASLLPRYRGAAPIQWAIANGDRVTGVTTMLMNEGLDTGDVLLRREVEIGPEDTGGSLHDKLAPVAAELIIETLAGLRNKIIPPVPQDESLATCAPRLVKEDGRIDWTMPARQVAYRVRAFDPWPGTFSCVGETVLKITRARAEAGEKKSEPGVVVAAGREGIVVACGEGVLRVVEVLPRGGRRMTAAEYLAGHRLEPGVILAPGTKQG